MYSIFFKSKGLFGRISVFGMYTFFPYSLKVFSLLGLGISCNEYVYPIFESCMLQGNSIFCVTMTFFPSYMKLIEEASP